MGSAYNPTLRSEKSKTREQLPPPKDRENGKDEAFYRVQMTSLEGF